MRLLGICLLVQAGVPLGFLLTRAAILMITLLHLAVLQQLLPVVDVPHREGNAHAHEEQARRDADRHHGGQLGFVVIIVVLGDGVVQKVDAVGDAAVVWRFSGHKKSC